MAYKTKKILAHKSNYGGKRSTKDIKYLVYHYTANKGDTAENNGNYFKNNIVKASANYFVDDDTVVESVPPEYIAYAVGGKKYSNCSSTGGGKFYGKASNSNTVNIEMCGDKNGKASAKTQENAIALGKELMKKYNIPFSNVIRHFDTTGKSCPVYFCGSATNEKAWKEFKARLKSTSSDTITFKKPSSNWIKQVQRKLGAKQNGIAGTETLSKTIKISKHTNQKHSVVIQVQNRLNSLGYSCGKADGVYGDKCVAAVKSLQKDMGLSKEHQVGWIEKGQTTWKVLLGLVTKPIK